MLGLSSVQAAEAAIEPWDPDQPPIVTGRPLRVQPVLAHDVMAPREKTSWRSWGDIVNEQAAAEEMRRIAGGIERSGGQGGLPAGVLAHGQGDDRRAGGAISRKAISTWSCCTPPRTPGCSAPAVPPIRSATRSSSSGTSRAPPITATSAWERATSRCPRPSCGNATAPTTTAAVTLDDVVVDDYDEVLWRLAGPLRPEELHWAADAGPGRALGKWDPAPPMSPAQRYKLDIVPIEYKELAVPAGRDPGGWEAPGAVRRLDRSLPGHAGHEAGNEEGVRPAGVRRLHRVPAVVAGVQGPAITVASCMGTIFGVANTAACMPLSWLNDEGYIAFCESDFVVMPPGILLHYITGKPVFMHNSTFPHKAMVTCAHCTAPRRMDGKQLRAGADHDPLRVRFRGRAQGRNADRAGGLRRSARNTRSPDGSASRGSSATTPATPSAAASRTWRSSATGSG